LFSSGLGKTGKLFIFIRRLINQIHRAFMPSEQTPTATPDTYTESINVTLRYLNLRWKLLPQKGPKGY
jgi:hypothetical protein